MVARILRRVYGPEGFTDQLGWRHSYPGMCLGAIGIAACGLGLAGVAPGASAWVATAGLLVGGVVDTLVASRWRPHGRSGTAVRRYSGEGVRISIDLARVAFHALSACALLIGGIGVWIGRGGNLLTVLSTAFFGALALYFLTVLLLARRWSLDLSEQGFRDRARVRPAAFVNWTEVASVSSRQIAGANHQVVVLKRPDPEGTGQTRLFINSGLLQGGHQRVLREMRRHLPDEPEQA